MIGLLLAVVAFGDPSPDDLAFFEKDVRPILVERCQGCHGEQKQKGDLRLDSLSAILAGGKTGPAVVPGKPEESVLIEAVNYGDLVQMPPKSKLPAPEIATLTKWVERGAPWPAEAKGEKKAAKANVFDLKERAKHWSFQPIVRHEPPDVLDTAWATSAIDRFVLSGLEAKSLKPAKEADKATFLRRVTFDLVGLPPSVAEIDAFLKDSSPNAYEKVVDRLLASPQYGERWGRQWLDLVRFAETSGHEFDYDIPNAWRYRDYVIRALNSDVPYDTFLTEHIAGDLVETPRRNPVDGSNESVLATGFYFLGEGTHSPVDVREDEVLRIDNQIDVISKTFLGLTVSCARCHDHKFDAISTKDYYALKGYLQSSRHQQAFIDDPRTIGGKIAELAAIKKKIAAASPQHAHRDDRSLAYASSAQRLLANPIALAENDVLFDDFESGAYAKWTSVGEAFGQAPIRLPVPDYQGEVGAKGKGLVGSHNGRVPGSVVDRDALTGTLTSREFTIDHDYVRFLIGGGSHAGKTCVNLLVDGRAVLSATGRDENPMRSHTFDVRAWKNRKAQLQVVDDDSGGWGNISLDHVVFSDRASEMESLDQRTAFEAKRAGLDPVLLKKWVAIIPKLPQDANANPSDHVFEMFDRDTFGTWTATGDAFGNGPSGSGAVRVHATQAVSVSPGVAHSGMVSDRLRGVLRSPTFPIDHAFIYLRTWGHSGRISVVIDGFEKIRSPIYGGLTLGVDSDAPIWATLDVSMWKGHRAYLELADGAVLDYSGANSREQPGEGFLAVDEIRFSNGPPPGLPSRPTTAEEAQAVASVFGLAESHVIPPALLSSYQAIEATIPEPKLALAILDGTGEDEYVHIRGSSKTLGDVVPRRFLEAIAGANQSPPIAGSGRLELAQKMLDPSCPFTARVMVNRLWKGHFGVGLVKTPDDFGIMGEAPSHPELLDWLADEFRKNGWSIKAMHKMMLLSRSYRMSSEIVPEMEAADPSNRLLHRINVRRLEGESVRDAMLFVSGRLQPKIGGPSVPPNLTPFMEGRGRPGMSGPLDGDGRRSLYINVRRNFLSPMLLAFDFPTPASTMGRRNVSNVPAQALVLLNDPFVIEQAKQWSTRIQAEGGASQADRIAFAYMTGFGRLPSNQERAEASAFLDRESAASWADLAHVLFNVKEFVFIP